MQAKGATPEAVLAELAHHAADDVDWHRGRILTGLYDPGETAYRLSVEAYTRFLTPNALYLHLPAPLRDDVLATYVNLVG